MKLRLKDLNKRQQKPKLLLSYNKRRKKLLNRKGKRKSAWKRRLYRSKRMN
jgi:hypothetical protein